MSTRHGARRQRQHGQAIVLFALSLVGLLAMGGLVLDGGGAYAQRRSGQDAADLAAVAGATAYTNTVGGGGSTTAGQTAARNTALQVASQNHYPQGNGTTVTVSVGSGSVSGQTLVSVTITRPHENVFATVIGQPYWNVTTTATAMTGVPNAAKGAMPIIFNERALGFANGHNPFADNYYNEPTNDPHVPKDVPQDETQFNWTVFCVGGGGNPCNGDSNTVDALIHQHGYNTVVTLDMVIGPLNAGAHTTLFDDMAPWIGSEFPVAIVTSSGAMRGWAMFHLTGTAGTSQKILEGYFVSQLNPEALTIVACNCTGAGFFGSYALKLVN